MGGDDNPAVEEIVFSEFVQQEIIPCWLEQRSSECSVSFLFFSNLAVDIECFFSYEVPCEFS
jgi:hypothetical protein